MNGDDKGDVLVLRKGAACARLAPALGGRVTACHLQGADGRVQSVLQAYPETHTDLDAWAKGGLYPLVPYSGRVRDARLQHEGQVWPLQAYPGSRHTLHGIAHRRPWALVERSEDRAVIACEHRPDDHWPWPFTATMTLVLSADALSVDLRLCNTGTQRMPAGIGLHPYVLHEPDEALRYRAGAPWPFDGDYLALGCAVPPPDVSDQLVSAAQCQAGEVTRFHARWQGPLDVLDRSSGLPRLRLQARGAMDQLVIHRPASAPYVCLEPVSHVADGFNLAAQGVPGTGTLWLEPCTCLQGGVVITAL